MSTLVEDLLLLARLSTRRVQSEQEQVALDEIVEAAVDSMLVVDPSPYGEGRTLGAAAAHHRRCSRGCGK